MLTIWTCIAATAVASFTIKAAGPALLGSRPLPDAVRNVVALLAPALLVALLITNLAGPHWRGLDMTVLAGVAAAGTARLLRAPLLLAVLAGILMTALLRTAS